MLASHFSPDVQEFIKLLHEYHVKYLIVGGEAVIYYGYARLTGDIDFFYEASPQNGENLYNALLQFWGGAIPGIEDRIELLEPGFVIQFGVPPNRIDLLNRIEGVRFREAWPEKHEVEIDIEGKKIPVYFISLEKLIKNKQAVKRPKDQEDLKYLQKIRSRKPPNP